jgi:hypothetical protein
MLIPSKESVGDCRWRADHPSVDAAVALGRGGFHSLNIAAPSLVPLVPLLPFHPNYLIRSPSLATYS